MNIQPDSYSVSKIQEYWSRSYLKVNHEYQRAPRWSRRQKQLLIDSVLRGYPLPLFYFHQQQEPPPGVSTTPQMEIIDGQQRIRAIVEFCNGEFPLLDPARHQNMFPKFIWDSDEPCGWANKHYAQLDFDLRDRLDHARLSIVIITTENDDEIRDLFVRLQAGSPLRPQEKRDAFPGGMPAFIKQLGGVTLDDDDQKPIVRDGHPFFRHFTRYSTPKRTHSAREMAAKIVMQMTLDSDGRPLGATNATALDGFYYDRIDFREDSDDAKNVLALFDDVTAALDHLEGARIDDTEWVHLFVLWRRLHIGYADTWKPDIANMLKKFKIDLTRSQADAVAMKPNPMWAGFGRLKSGSGPDAASKFRQRQEFFDAWFIDKLKPSPIDQPTSSDKDLRQLLFDAQAGTCGYIDHIFCDRSAMKFDDSAIHHVLPHSLGGGETVPGYPVVVHQRCKLNVGSETKPVTAQLILNAIKSAMGRT